MSRSATLASPSVILPSEGEMIRSRARDLSWAIEEKRRWVVVTAPDGKRINIPVSVHDSSWSQVPPQVAHARLNEQWEAYQASLRHTREERAVDQFMAAFPDDLVEPEEEAVTVVERATAVEPAVEAQPGAVDQGRGGETPLICPECSKPCKNAPGLGSHRQKTHGVAGTHRTSARPVARKPVAKKTAATLGSAKKASAQRPVRPEKSHAIPKQSTGPSTSAGTKPATAPQAAAVSPEVSYPNPIDFADFDNALEAVRLQAARAVQNAYDRAPSPEVVAEAAELREKLRSAEDALEGLQAEKEMLQRQVEELATEVRGHKVHKDQIRAAINGHAPAVAVAKIVGLDIDFYG